MRKLKVAIDFRVEDPRQGVGTAVLTLVQGLSRLQPSDQEYVVIVPQHLVEWITPHLGEAFTVAALPIAVPTWRSRLASIPLLRRLWIRARGKVRLAKSDGTLERLGCDVVHFPSQVGYLTDVPSIYQPWDLQHRHLPQFFPAEDILLRETCYRAFCQQARFVCVQTQWGKQDLIDQYHLPADKLVVIRWGADFAALPPPTAAEAEQLFHHFDLPQQFFLYPAVTWPHKNHELILQALALRQQHGQQAVHVVFTGKAMPAQVKLEALARRLKVDLQIHFLGFVSREQLGHLLHLATAMLFPSRFEGLGLPLLEAFQAGLPVLCSSATVLPEVAGDAALLFDPDSPEQLADAIERVLNSPDLRAQLVAAGKTVLAEYSSDLFAREFASLYRACGSAQVR